MPIATCSPVALDCQDPESLARFHADVLGGEVNRFNEVWYDVYAPGGIRIACQYAPDHRPPSRPRATTIPSSSIRTLRCGTWTPLRREFWHSAPCPSISTTTAGSGAFGCSPIRLDTLSVSVRSDGRPVPGRSSAGGKGT